MGPGGNRAAGDVFDHVEIKEDNGLTRSVTKQEWEKMGLRARCVLLMSGKVEFFRGSQPISAREALRNK